MTSAGNLSHFLKFCQQVLADLSEMWYRPPLFHRAWRQRVCPNLASSLGNCGKAPGPEGQKSLTKTAVAPGSNPLYGCRLASAIREAKPSGHGSPSY